MEFSYMEHIWCTAFKYRIVRMAILAIYLGKADMALFNPCMKIKYFGQNVFILRIKQ